MPPALQEEHHYAVGHLFLSVLQHHVVGYVGKHDGFPAAGIGGFRKMQAYGMKAAPLRRNVTIEEVGNAAAFLCSDLASGITGETTFVDAGVNIMGMVFDEE